MKTPRASQTEKPVPKFPIGWEDASWTEFDKLAKEYPDWFETIAKRPGRNLTDWLPKASRRPTPEQQHTAYAILCEQISYWRERASEAEEHLPEYMKPFHPSIPAEELDPALKKMPLLSRQKKKDLKRRPVFGAKSVLDRYDWLAARHASPQLRCALGYTAKGFQAFRTAAKIGARPSEGKARFYTFDEALVLLSARFQRKRPNQKRRQAIAQAIWDRVKMRNESDSKDALRDVLMRAGANCTAQ